MLDDLKSLFATTSVAEVGVGVTLGVALTSLIVAITDSGKSLFDGEFVYSGVLQALVVLLSVALLSVFAVVRPLAGLKKKLAAVQVAKVSAAVQQARGGDVAGAVSTAREAGLPVPGGRSADGAIATAEAGAVPSDSTVPADGTVPAEGSPTAERAPTAIGRTSAASIDAPSADVAGTPAAGTGAAATAGTSGDAERGAAAFGDAAGPATTATAATTPDGGAAAALGAGGPASTADPVSVLAPGAAPPGDAAEASLDGGVRTEQGASPGVAAGAPAGAAATGTAPAAVAAAPAAGADVRAAPAGRVCRPRWSRPGRARSAPSTSPRRDPLRMVHLRARRPGARHVPARRAGRADRDRRQPGGQRPAGSTLRRFLPRERPRAPLRPGCVLRRR